MARTHISFRTWVALFLLGALVVLFAMLGNWQLDRAAQRDAIHARIQHAAQIEPVTLTAITPDAELVPWRRAQAQGHWLHQYTVLLENRNYQSRPGYWVATPLQLDPRQTGMTRNTTTNGDTTDHTTLNTPTADTYAVLVLRGWLARDDITVPGNGGVATFHASLGHDLAQPRGEHTVNGELFPHVPRLFELWSWSNSDGAELPAHLSDTRDALPAVQNLDLADYKRATGLNLLPTVLAADDSRPAMLQDWPHPTSDSDTNRGYAVQWFSFCLIAAGAWLFIAWRATKQFFN